MKETKAKISIKLKLVLWEDKNNWQTISQTHQGKKKTQINKTGNKKEVTTDNTKIQSIIGATICN